MSRCPSSHTPNTSWPEVAARTFRDKVLRGLSFVTVLVCAACESGLYPAHSSASPPPPETTPAPAASPIAPNPVTPNPNATSTASTPVNNADAVIAGLRMHFRRCYQAGLNVDPNIEGRVVISASVSPTGEVESASVMHNEGLPDSVAECIRNVVAGARFDAPGGTGSTLNIPVTFRKVR